MQAQRIYASSILENWRVSNIFHQKIEAGESGDFKATIAWRQSLQQGSLQLQRKRHAHTHTRQDKKSLSQASCISSIRT